MGRHFLFFTLLLNIKISAQIISTVAGNGTIGYSGDGGPAINAQLGDMYYTYPAFDNVGNMYIAQNGNNTIRKIDASGIITTIAGTNGVIGYSGDGGPAINALLYHPTAIAIDNANNIYFADRNGDIIRKIDPVGIITTVSGQATTTCGVGDGGPLAQARFRAISALSFDQLNNLYIADFGCDVIRMVNNAGIINTIAGNGTHGFSGDGGPATLAQLAYPCKVAIDNTGNIYIPDAQNHRIRKINTSGIITTIAGTGISGYSGDGGPATLAQLSFPGSVIIDNGNNLYIGDYNDVIRKIDVSGNISTFAGTGITGYSGDGGPAILANLRFTEGRISIDNNFNNIYFVNYLDGNVIRKITNCITASIIQQPVSVTLCNTGNAAFSIIASNMTGLQWQVNNGSGWSNVSNTGVYSGATTSTLSITGAGVSMNGYQYRCVVGNSCGNIFSIVVTLNVLTPTTPIISISTSQTTICSGVTATFNAIITNGGSTPVYQWKKNSNNVGTNSAVYSDNTLTNGDQISCQVTSNANCLINNIAMSNIITMIVNPILTPSISITASSINICTGATVNFSSLVNNTGNNPSYQWRKNGFPVGINSPSYSDNNLNNGDIIACFLTSNYACSLPISVLSNTIFITVMPMVTPSITINTPSTSICPNASAIFTATSQNSGVTPIYQWKKNGILVGNNATTYTDNNIIQGDVITCLLTASGNCLTSSTANSNSIMMSIYPNPTVSLDHTSWLCEGSSRQLNAGNFSTFLWNDGSMNQILIVNNIGTYYVTVSDNNGCKASDTTKITTLLFQPKNFLPRDTTICSYGTISLVATPGFKSYLWNVGLNTPTITISQPGLYWLEVLDNNNCKGRDSVVVLSKDCIKGFYIPTGFTPNNDGKNDYFMPLIFGNVKSYNFTIYNRYGQTVFHSTELKKGWDGKFGSLPQDSNVFIWVCRFQLEGEKQEFRKGTFILIR